MKVICPNFKNKEVKELFEELSNVLGENTAYYVWSYNNGYSLDYAPNGALSKLFSDLLEYYKGDRRSAIIAKAKTYSPSFRNWFGDWTSENEENVSKVIDKNNEPLIVYHGGAQNITEFKHSTEDNTTTGYGFYTDEKTGNKIPVDSNRAMFFSSNKHVGTSYGLTYAIILLDLLKHKVYSLIETVREGAISKDVFKSLDDFYNTLDELSEYNIRFSKLKEYIILLKERGGKLNNREREAFREILIDTRKTIGLYTEKWLLNLSQWDDVLSKALKVLTEYSTDKKIQKLIDGEIPEVLMLEWKLYEKILQQREKQGLDKIANYDKIHFTLSNIDRYYLIYDGKNLQTWTPDYSDKLVKELTIEELKKFIEDARRSNEIALSKNKENEKYKYLQTKFLMYPVFLNIKNPLVHDYEGTHQGLGYKQSQKHSFGYVSARLVDKAIKEGNDGVVYENLYDPYLADNYGVFDPNQIKSVDNRGTYSLDNNNIYQYAVDSKINRIDGEESRNVVFFKENQLGKESLLNMLLNNFFEEDSIEIANNIYNKLDDSVQFVLDNDNKGYDAAYDTKSKKVYINPLIFNTYTNKDIGRIILHELLHHFTVNEYNNNNIFKQDINDLFNKIKNKINPTKDQLKHPLYYGLNSPLEFISELYTNHSFRDLVLKKNTSLWKRLLTKLLKALKLNKLASKLESKNNDKVNTLINEISNIIDNHHTDSRFDNYGDGLLKYDTKDVNLMYINENAKLIAKDILAGLKASEKALRSRGKSPIVLTKLQLTIDKYDTAFLKEDNILITTDFINEASKQFKPVLDLMRKAKFDNSLLSNDDLINFKSDFLDFYGPMCQTIDKELLLQGYFDELPEEQRDTIAIDMDLINRAYNEIQGIYSYILRNRAAQILKEQGEVFGFDTKDIEDYIQNSLNSGEGDINYFTLILRPTMSLKDTIMRITYRMMADLNNNVQTFANEKALSLIREFDKIDRKDQLLYFEKDNDGKTTGYLVRDRKYGQFFRDKNDFMSELNTKYGVIDGNRYTLNEDEFKEYSREREEWLSKHCERRFKPEYYKQYSNLKSVTQLKLKSLNGEIQSIIQSITRSDGVHLEELDDKSWRNLNRLYLLKRNMSNIYNFDGSLKKGEDRDIAEDLTNFYDNLGSGKIKSLSMTSEEVEKIIKQKEKELSPELFNKWVQRNISYEYTEEFYEQLKKDFNAGKDQDKYESLMDERRKLMRLGRNNLIPKTDAYQLSIDVKKRIKEIDQELQDIRNKYKTLNEKSNFGKIAKMMVTEEYERDKKEAEAKGGKAYDEWYKMSHYTNGRGEDEPVSYYKITTPKDDKYIRIRLSRMNQELDKDSALINPNYDFNNPEYYQPKKELYDNSKEYQKATNTEEKRNIYNLIYNTLQEANDKIPFLNNRSNYKLPQMTGDIVDFSCRGNKFWKGIIKYNVDNLIVRSDDSDYNLDTFTLRPDGSQVKFAPTHYIQDLENPENISRNLVGMLTEYSRMAENYRLKNENASTFEVLGEQMGQRRVTIRNRFTGSQQKIEGKRTRLYQKLNDFYDIQLYGQKLQPALGRISDKLVISYTKLFNRIKNYASASNLSWNIPSIMKAQLQGLHKSLIEALSGRYFSINDYYHALFRQIFSIPKMLYHLGDKKHNTLTLALMENAGIARDIGNKIDGLLYNRFIRTLKKYIIWGGWSATDWMVKAPLVESIYSDYMYIPSENNFMSKRAYIRKYHNDNWKEGNKAFKNINTFSLLDVYTVKNGVLVIKPEYEKYTNIINNTNLLNSVINTCRFITNRIDGVLSLEDKTKFMTNAVGACVIMHRSFFIRNLDDNLFAELQYNPYIEDYYEAKYTSAFKVLWHYARNLVAVVLKNPNLKSKNRLESVQVYNFKRTTIQLGLILMLYLLISLYLEPEADKDKKNWLKLIIGYVFAAVRFEEFAEYNPFDFFNQIKSPSAAIAPVENVTNMIKLFDPISFENNFKEIKKGPYKGMERWLRTLIKSVPGLRGVWESRDVRTKWEYLNTQLDK